MSEIIGIYEIVHASGVRYVGQSTRVKRRLVEHKRDLRANNGRDNSHLQHIWNQSCETDFEFRLIEECAVEELNTRELYWSEFHRERHQLVRGRLRPCTNRGVKQTQETISKRVVSLRIRLQSDPDSLKRKQDAATIARQARTSNTFAILSHKMLGNKRGCKTKVECLK